jgi:hypothetical protein
MDRDEVREVERFRARIPPNCSSADSFSWALCLGSRFSVREPLGLNVARSKNCGAFRRHLRESLAARRRSFQ